MSTAGVLIGTYVTPTANSDPVVVAYGQAGLVWFTEFKGNAVASISTSGSIAEYPIQTANSQPDGITLGPGGVMWFAQSQGNNIAHF
jgi:virginiamycin B lyase